ncbi:MAG TPA: cytochrome c [Acidobacteriota bacterium]|nr:cytochrome c [Acidobacteriota bacterium]
MATHSFSNGDWKPRASRVLVMLTSLLALSITGCRLDMHDQPKYQVYEESAFFPDGRASRNPPDGTVAQGQLREDVLLYTGKVGNQDSQVFPFPITEEMLRRGQERYNVFCAPCHDRAGTGQGMIVERGMTRPPSLHTVRLREAPPGYFFDVITNGFGAMFSYASRIPAEDRWAIIAYIRALQLSQNATYGQVPDEVIGQLEEAENESEQ